MTGSLKYGVSTYSYVEDYGSVMTLADAFDQIYFLPDVQVFPTRAERMATIVMP